MKLKFVRAVAAGSGIYQAGQVAEVKDRHAAEVYMAHGYAVAADPAGAGNVRSTLGGPRKRDGAVPEVAKLAAPKK